MPDAGDLVVRAYKRFYFSPASIFSVLKRKEFYRHFLKNVFFGIRLLFLKFKRSGGDPGAAENGTAAQ